jgi:hypothetical protein
MPAMTIFGSFGLTATSDAPVVGVSPPSTFFQVWPPSSVR